MSLQEEIEKKSKEIRTDGYPMSIGELASIYEDGELDIHPEFQRFFRWDKTQKSKLIESILLGIPIPPIFVSQNEKGIWDVIDGVQRLSTIFEFMGILKNENNNAVTASTLTETKFLPSLKDKCWKEAYGDKSLDVVQRRFIKRSKLDIKIIDKSSDPTAKYELFQRLNTGGTRLSPQEIRNCLLVMINKDFYRLIKVMNENKDFQACIPLSDNSLDKQDDMELIVRFLVARHCNFENIKGNENIHEYFTNQIMEIAQNKSISFEEDKKNFIATFEYLNKLLGENTFVKYYVDEDKFKRGVSITSFEVIALGISKNINTIENKNDNEIINKIKNIYSTVTYNESLKSRPIKRFKELSLFSMEYFSNENQNS